MGRKSTYSQKVADAIVAWISLGKPLREFCRLNELAWSTVYDWLEAQPEFAVRFARARDVGADAIAEQALEIADTPLEGVRTETTSGEDGCTKEVREDMLGHRKLQVETRLKLLAKWFPQKYGDKTEHTINGPVTLDLKGSDVHG
jgi:hypothetical protein